MLLPFGAGQTCTDGRQAPTDLHYYYYYYSSPSSSGKLSYHHQLIFSQNLTRSPANMIDPVQAFAMATGTLQEAAAKASVSASMFALHDYDSFEAMY